MRAETGSLAARREEAIRAIRAIDQVVVALSGGVDSAVLLTLAVEAVGPARVIAATGWSASVTDGDLADARAIAARLGVRHEVVETHELDRPEYRANQGDRCYHCRVELFDLLERIAGRYTGSSIVYGAILDDLGDDRPGMKAAEERGVIAPLLGAGITKEDIRTLARRAGIGVADKPASPCLASRIPVGEEVTAPKLRQIDVAEAALRALGFRRFRVRHHGDVARLEVDLEGTRLLEDPSVRARVIAGVKGAGFKFVTADLTPFRSGSLSGAAAGTFYRIDPALPSGQ